MIITFLSNIKRRIAGRWLRLGYLFILITIPLIVIACWPFGTQYRPQTRTYYMTAENVVWDYAPSSRNLIKNSSVNKPWGLQTKYNKVRYIEYTDASFTQKKNQPEWLGIMGPIIRGVEGDIIRVVFYNKAKKPYSLHPHGLLYDKDNEGAAYSGIKGKGAKILPGQKYTYTWHVPSKIISQDESISSQIWMYHSHVNPVSDIYEGLLGPIIITSAKHARKDGTPDDVDREFINLFFIFNESEEGMSEEEAEGHLMHSINGFIFGNLKGLIMKQREKVRWHLIGMGTEVDIHTPHWHGEVVNDGTKITDVIELLPASMKTVDMRAENPGTWLYHCHVTDHITAGMITTYKIE